MPTYRVNKDAVAQARKLIDAGKYDDDHRVVGRRSLGRRRNAEIEKHGYEVRRLAPAIDPDATEETKGRHTFPYGDFTKVNRAALIHGKQRASQNDHDAIEKAFDDLLQRLDEKRDARAFTRS